MKINDIKTMHKKLCGRVGAKKLEATCLDGFQVAFPSP